MNQFCFLIPSYQHSESLKKVLDALEDFQLPCIVVNDGSDEFHTKNLRETCTSKTWVHLFEHHENQGKGGAVITGLKEAKKLNFSHAIQVDSDGQHDLTNVSKLIEMSNEYPQSVISGQPQYDESVPTGRKIGRYITHFWVWVECLSFKIKDSMCGFRVYPLDSCNDLLEKSKIGKRMDFDIEILVRLYWAGVEPIFIPVNVIYPEDGSSHFRMLMDNILISIMHTKLVFEMPFRLLLRLIKRGLN